jgi:acyl carrier protein
MENEILNVINEIRKNKGLDPIFEINYQSKLRNDLGLSSFDLAEMTVIIEDKYGIDIFEDGLVFTIEDVINKLK